MTVLRLFVAIALLSTLFSCRDTNDTGDIVASLIGKEIIIPDALTFKIMNQPLENNTIHADYRIIAYIDSTGCTQCRMKLPIWTGIINELKSATDDETEILMILNTTEEKLVNHIIKHDKYQSPVCIDSMGLFASVNDLPSAERYHTFLLDNNNQIIAVGNPAINPKIRKLYRQVISDGYEYTSHHLCHEYSIPLGIISPGDTVTHTFNLQNDLNQSLKIENIVPSCDCISATITSKTIASGTDATASIILVADSLCGLITRHIDIFFHEQDVPERLTLYGYVQSK